MSLDLVRALTRLQDEADELAAIAERLELHPRAFPKSVSEVENDLASRWRELDKALEGIEREERVRADVRRLGGRMLGASDTEVGRALGLPPGSKIPDIATDLGGSFCSPRARDRTSTARSPNSSRRSVRPSPRPLRRLSYGFM